MSAHDRDYEEEKRRQLEDLERKKRSTLTLSNADAKEDDDGLVVYYCRACGTYAFAVLGIPLHRLPRRRTDSSYVVDMEAHTCRLSLQQGKVVAVKREQGVEKQYRHHCSSCDLFIAYQNQDFDAKPKYVYVTMASVISNPNTFLKIRQQHDEVPACIEKEKGGKGEDGAAACRVVVEVTPEAARTVVAAINDSAVSVLATSSSHSPRLNEEVSSFLAFILGLPNGAVTVEGGLKAVKKSLRVAGLLPGEAYERIFAAIP